MKYFFINLILNIFFVLPDWFLERFFPKKGAFIRNKHLDRQSRIFLKLIGIFGYKPNVDNFNNEERINSNKARMSLNLNKKPPNKFSFKDVILAGGSDIIVREYIPDSLASDKVMLYFHGGGYALGSIETHHNFVASMSVMLGIKIYSLEYSLSPENKYPRALEDSKQAYRYILDKGVSSNKVLLCGDSAGAHLAASLNFDLTESDLPMPSAQILIYPMISPTLQFESMELYKDNFLLTKSSMEWFWNQLRSNNNDDLDPRFDLLKQRGFDCNETPTLMITAGFDPLCDEGNDYAKLLEKNGNNISRLHFSDLFHGFVNLTNIRKAEQGTLEIISRIKAYL